MAVFILQIRWSHFLTIAGSEAMACRGIGAGTFANAVRNLIIDAGERDPGLIRDVLLAPLFV